LELNSIARTINFYSVKLLEKEQIEKVLFDIMFEFQMSAYYKFNFLIYNYKKEECYLTYYQGLDLDDKMQDSLKCKSKFVSITYPTSDKKNFLYQVELINKLDKTFKGYIYDTKNKKIISARDVKFLF
jgi:hypothetical protein